MSHGKKLKEEARKKSLRKKTLSIAIAIIIILLVLFVPLKKKYEDDTVSYSALTYKIVNWNKETPYGTYVEKDTYIFPKNLKDIDTLWKDKENSMEHTFSAEIVEIYATYAVVKPVENTIEYDLTSSVIFNLANMSTLDAKVGDIVSVTYKGNIVSTNPNMINATSWSKANIYTKTYEEINKEPWLDKNNAIYQEDNILSSVYIIKEKYSDSFIVTPYYPLPTKLKVNGILPDIYCIGDQVEITGNHVYTDTTGENKAEIDLLNIKPSNIEMDPNVCYKPVIYLYPTTEIEVEVKLTLNGELTCTYPRYNNGWKVIAKPNGTLKIDNLEYNYLYWEGVNYIDIDFSKGFCVKKEDTAKFLEESLEKLGLNRKEANEFIVYWLPLMEQNEYNLISFQGENYTESAKLEIYPNPDTEIRIFMAFKGLDKKIEITPQELISPNRLGFTVIEWGGTEVK